MKNQKERHGLVKMNGKQRILGGVLMAIIYALPLFVFDFLSDNANFTLLDYILQCCAFGILMGIGTPYVSEKFYRKFLGATKKQNAKETQ